MPTCRLLLPTILAASLIGCQTPSGNGSIDELPSSNPTGTTAELATG